MTSSLTRQPDGNIVITLTFPWADIQAGYEKEVQHAIEESEVPGFRKGKAPRNMVEPKLNRSETFSHSLQHILPQAYQEAVTKHDLKPILYPKLNIEKAQENSDWVVTATTCESPVVTVPDYKTDLPKLNQKDKPRDDQLGVLANYFRERALATIPQILLDEEINHRLAGLAENLTGLGLTTQTYLANKKLTLEDLKKQFGEQASIDITVEFALASIQAENKLSNRAKTLDFLLAML
jgi:FKBP-type peptidyl-prolyl cis-trans isomerase (trigger factor)